MGTPPIVWLPQPVPQKVVLHHCATDISSLLAALLSRRTGPTLVGPLFSFFPHEGGMILRCSHPGLLFSFPGRPFWICSMPREEQCMPTYSCMCSLPASHLFILLLNRQILPVGRPGLSSFHFSRFRFCWFASACAHSLKKANTHDSGLSPTSPQSKETSSVKPPARSLGSYFSARSLFPANGGSDAQAQDGQQFPKPQQEDGTLTHNDGNNDGAQEVDGSTTSYFFSTPITPVRKQGRDRTCNILVPSLLTFSWLVGGFLPVSAVIATLSSPKKAPNSALSSSVAPSTPNTATKAQSLQSLPSQHFATSLSFASTPNSFALSFDEDEEIHNTPPGGMHQLQAAEKEQQPSILQQKEDAPVQESKKTSLSSLGSFKSATKSTSSTQQTMLTTSVQAQPTVGLDGGDQHCWQKAASPPPTPSSSSSAQVLPHPCVSLHFAHTKHQTTPRKGTVARGVQLSGKSKPKPSDHVHAQDLRSR